MVVRGRGGGGGRLVEEKLEKSGRAQKVGRAAVVSRELASIAVNNGATTTDLFGRDSLHSSE